MTAQLPTRITIELQPSDAGGSGSGWTARTAVDDVPIGFVPPHAAEPREVLPVPTAYEPAPCTCLDADGCHADHANE